MSLKNVLASYLKRPCHLYPNVRLRLLSSVSDREHIFIVGAPRSGTTLLQSILSVSDQIASFDDETGFFMYRDVFSRSFEGVPEEAYKRICKENNDIVQIFDGLAQSCLDINPGTVLFLEKTPQHVLFLGYLVKHFPESKFVNVFRDVRDAAVSARRFSEISQGQKLTAYLNYWNKCINARLEVSSPNIIDIRYESLVSNPEFYIQKLSEFLNIEYSPRLIDPTFFSKNHRAGSSGFAKLAKPIDNKSVGVWQKELSNNELAILYKISGKQLRKIGYL